MHPKALLVILDGWGHSPQTEHNAIAQAHTPVWDRLWNSVPRTLIDTSGAAVGLPSGQMGNSEVGHLMLGAGRVLLQDLTRIDRAISNGEFWTNSALAAAIDSVKRSGGRVHLLGLLSPGGVHSHERHFRALMDLLDDQRVPYAIHAFLDGRDTPPKSARPSLEAIDQKTAGRGLGRLASIGGRFYGMDRDSRWERIEFAYRLIAQGQSEHCHASGQDALSAAYSRGETDEFVIPTRIGDPLPLRRQDAAVFMNFRADRARQLSRTLLSLDSSPIRAEADSVPGMLVAMASYAEDIDQGTPNTAVRVAFESPSVENTLGEYWAACGYPQHRIAESEKTAHVTFFFSGGRDQCFHGETRELLPSPRVRTYDLKPEMNAPEVACTVVRALHQPGPRLVVCNFANGDMVGHTGNMDAAIRAVETIDGCLGNIERSVATREFHCLITADHGNVEHMSDASGKPHTAHTTGPVPLLYLGPERGLVLRPGGLCDVAPTLLNFCGMAVPSEMTGRSLMARSDTK